MSVFKLTMPYIFNFWLKLPMLEMFSELQLIEAIEIFGKITGMAERKRAPKSIERRNILAVFEE